MGDNSQLFPFTRKPEIILKNGDILEVMIKLIEVG